MWWVIFLFMCLTRAGVETETLKKEIQEVKDLFVVCDHTRSCLVAICDGSLPSNQGGAANLRNLLRRVFSILERRGWWTKIGGMDGLMHLFELHRIELAQLWGSFPVIFILKEFFNCLLVEFEIFSVWNLCSFDVHYFGHL
jgi:hypothetical protein